MHIKFMHLIFSNPYYSKTESIIIYNKTEINLINPLSILFIYYTGILKSLKK